MVKKDVLIFFLFAICSGVGTLVAVDALDIFPEKAFPKIKAVDYKNEICLLNDGIAPIIILSKKCEFCNPVRDWIDSKQTNVKLSVFEIEDNFIAKSVLKKAGNKTPVLLTDELRVIGFEENVWASAIKSSSGFKCDSNKIATLDALTSKK